jgi:hypothetical protein
VHRRAVLLTLALASSARADGTVVGGRYARTIGRAGVVTASDDGAGALLANPAGMARREGARIQLGLSFVDDELYWIDAASAPAIRDQSSSRLLPLVAIEGALGDFIVGAGVMTAARSERILLTPRLERPEDFGSFFQHRYAGLQGAFRRDTLVVGASRRLGDTVAMGLSFGVSRAEVLERRRLWAGDNVREDLSLAFPNAQYDCDLSFDAADNFVPSAVAGVLVAPADSRIELALSLGWSAPVRARGDVGGFGTAGTTAVVLSSDASARIEVEQPITARSGARWLGESWIIEVGADLWYFPRRAIETEWRIDGVSIFDNTTLGASRQADLTTLTSRVSSRTHGALRGAIDIELMSGFLWATGGYAYATAGTSGARQSPTFGDLGGHTVGLGLEANAGAFTLTFGWGRTWSVRSPEPVTAWQLDNPFSTGDGPIPNGTFDGSTDMIGISIDAELDVPE